MSAAPEISHAPAHARVLVVDDQDGFRSIIRRLVAAAPGLDLLAEAHSGETAIAAVHELRPDLVVMDVFMPGIGGIDAARSIKASCPGTVVVLVSTTHPDDLPCDAAASGADEIVWKSDLRPSLLASIWHRHCAARPT